MVIPFKGHTIFAFADTHGMYRRLAIPAEADILICAGDACEGFNPADLQDFFAWYTAITAKLRIFVPGNHDRILNQEPGILLSGPRSGLQAALSLRGQRPAEVPHLWPRPRRRPTKKGDTWRHHLSQCVLL